MGRKSVLEPYKVIDGGDLAAATTTSLITNVEKLDAFTYIMQWDGSSVEGSSKVQVKQVAPFRGSGVFETDWIDLDFGADIEVTGDTGGHTITVRNFGFTQSRIVYTKTTGTGELNVTIAGLVAGA